MISEEQAGAVRRVLQAGLRVCKLVIFVACTLLNFLLTNLLFLPLRSWRCTERSDISGLRYYCGYLVSVVKRVVCN